MILIEDERHYTFIVNAMPGHGEHRVVILKDRSALEDLKTKYPRAAFWSAGAFRRYVDIVKKEIAKPIDRLKDLVQINALKIAFGPGAIQVLLDDMDGRKMCAESGMDFLDWKRMLERKPKETKDA